MITELAVLNTGLVVCVPGGLSAVKCAFVCCVNSVGKVPLPPLPWGQRPLAGSRDLAVSDDTPYPPTVILRQTFRYPYDQNATSGVKMFLICQDFQQRQREDTKFSAYLMLY